MLSRQPLTSRHNNFDFLRFFLATLVIFGHSSALIYYRAIPFGQGDDISDLLAWLTHGQMYSGRIAVYGFFTISGFLITQSWLNSKSLHDYLRKRVQRIYPGFLVASLTCAFVFAPLGASNRAEYWQAMHWCKKPLLLSVLALRAPIVPSTVQHNPLPNVINGSLWTIQPEFICYLLVAALGLAAVLRRPRIVVGFAVLAIVAYWLTTLHEFHRLSQPLASFLCSPIEIIPNMAYFAAGMACAVYRDRLNITDRTALIATVVLLIATQIPHGMLFVFPFCLPVLLLWLAFTPRIRLNSWSKPFGDLSYGIYLYAFPIQQLLIAFVPALRQTLPLFVVSTLLTLPCALLSWHLVEKPFLSRKRKQEISETSQSS